VFCVSHHRAVKLCAPLQEKVLVSVWSRRTDADMLAGARHSSDQLGFWSHSKSAVVCRCRNLVSWRVASIRRPSPSLASPVSPTDHDHLHSARQLPLPFSSPNLHPESSFGPGAGGPASLIAAG